MWFLAPLIVIAPMLQGLGLDPLMFTLMDKLLAITSQIYTYLIQNAITL
jgi:hypothetical protein